MLQIIKYVAIVIFVIVFIFVTFNITKGIATSIIDQQTESITEGIVSQFTGGFTSNKLEKKPCNLPKHQREFKSEQYYIGPLIDSHVHFPTSSKIVSSVTEQNGLYIPMLEEDLAAANLICLFESEGITKTFAFHITSKFAEGSAVSSAKQIEEAYPGKIVHFLMPPPVKSLIVDPSEIEGILNKNQGLFRGYGEVALYMDGYEGIRPNDPQLKEIYKLAREHNLVVMIHPEDELRDGIEEILKEFPTVNFFFHGGRSQEWVIELMDKYPNFYYSIDGDLVSLYGYDRGLQFKNVNAKEDYLSYLRKNFNANLEEAVIRWKGRIEKHPDRFTWGTDRWYEWHFDPEVGSLLEEFGRSFIGRLDPKVQENFAYKNAEKMLE